MKKLVNYINSPYIWFMSLMLLSNLPSIATATSINLLSSDYHIAGTAGLGYLEPNSSGGSTSVYIVTSYSDYSSLPISDDVIVATPDCCFGSAEASSSAEAFQEHVYSSSGAGYLAFLGPAPEIASSDATWIFQTPGSYVTLNIDWIYHDNRSLGYSYGDVWLNDLTTNTDLFYLHAIPLNSPILSYSDTVYLNLNPDHFYSMRMYSQASSADDSIDYNIAAHFSVPELSSLPLLVIGLFGLVILGKFNRDFV